MVSLCLRVDIRLVGSGQRRIKKKVIFRSTYEFAYFKKLEKDDSVESYLVEAIEIPYLCQKGCKYYKPDLMVLYTDGSIKVIEVKPKKQLTDVVVMQKARALKAHIKKNMKNTTFGFITEDDIFESREEYESIKKQLSVRS